MEPQIIKNYNVGQKYRIVIERAASTKGTLGYKIEANSDNIITAIDEAAELKHKVEEIAGLAVVEEKK